jgi:hypothetical protein
MVRKATCCCGKCSIEVDGEPALNAVCHCNSCKRRTGSAFGWSAYFTDDRVLQKVGDLKAYAVPGEVPATRYFCSHCGSTLYWKADILPGHTGIAGGCFADAAPLEAPSMSSYDDRRCAWVALPDHWFKSP